MKSPKDFPLTVEQKRKVKEMLDQIEQMAATGHILPFVLEIGGDRRVFEEVARQARAAGWNAHFDGQQLTVRAPAGRR